MPKLQVTFTVLKMGKNIVGVRLYSCPNDPRSLEYCSGFQQHLNKGLARIFVDVEVSQIQFHCTGYETLIFTLNKDEALSVRSLLTEGPIKIEVRKYGLSGFDIYPEVIGIFRKKTA